MPDAIKTDLAAAYDLQSAARDRTDTADWKIAERDRFLGMVRAEHKQTLLEIGAGPGRDSRFFRDQGLGVACSDLSGQMMRLARAKGLPACVADYYDLPFAAASCDAVWSLNTLLHVPKADLPGVLRSVRAVLRPGGLFFMGLYGGPDSEGVWEGDSYRPKRFFSFYPDAQIQAAAAQVFALERFAAIPVDREKNDAPIHFQSLILRNAA